ncbi:hypothetical protein JZ751_023732, partial [Albula glossodonta]
MVQLSDCAGRCSRVQSVDAELFRQFRDRPGSAAGWASQAGCGEGHSSYCSCSHSTCSAIPTNAAALPVARARAEVPDAATAMNLSSDGLMVECYLRPRQVGKVKRRVQEMRYISALTTEMDLSHNESARLATDALLDRGLTAYRQVLASEGEVDFLSELEKDYILGNATHQANGAGSGDTEEEQEAPASPPGSSETYFPVCSESEPPGLEYGWPVPDWSYHLQGKPSVEVLFRADRSASMKDLLRENINKATTLLAIVMDIFTDVEIFCDLLEATRKRGVSVYLLLNHVNLSLFLDMCKDLSISSTHLTKMSIRSVQGETYCAKSGRKFSGQIKENFVIIDCTQAFAGSFSFTWLSWQVHRSLAVLVKGSGVKPFDLEFRRLYATSKPVTGLPTAAPPLDIAKPLGHGQSLLSTCPPAAPATTRLPPALAMAPQQASWAFLQSAVTTKPQDGGTTTPSTPQQSYMLTHRDGGTTPQQNFMLTTQQTYVLTPKDGGTTQTPAPQQRYMLTPRDSGTTPQQSYVLTPKDGGTTPPPTPQQRYMLTPRDSGTTPQQSYVLTPRDGGTTPQQNYALISRDSGGTLQRSYALTPRAQWIPQRHPVSQALVRQKSFSRDHANGTKPPHQPGSPERIALTETAKLGMTALIGPDLESMTALITAHKTPLLHRSHDTVLLLLSEDPLFPECPLYSWTACFTLQECPLTAEMLQRIVHLQQGLLASLEHKRGLLEPQHPE